MGQLMDIYRALTMEEGGKAKFASIVCETAPYFSSIFPEVLELREAYSKWLLRKRREVENHLSTVHAIAICNLCEITAGLCIESMIPDNKRWIPTGLNIRYLKKAKTDLVAICESEAVDWERTLRLDLQVRVYDMENELVAEAVIPVNLGAQKAQ